MNNERRLLKLKERELELWKAEVQKQKDLPHLYSEKKLYKWALDFIETNHKECYICGANQISKSSTLIRKCITWATEPERWPALWKTQPNLFWYLYPDADTATSEFDTKWQEWLPQGTMKDDPQYGWVADYQNKKIKNVYFNSGITLSFKYYTQDVANLQAGSVYAFFADEEIPTSILPELNARLNATDGYANYGFTATLGQEYFFNIIEGDDKPEAWKKQVSLYDCMEYWDGTQSLWDEGKIQRAIARCASKKEVARRIYGKFVKDDDSDLLIPKFSEEKNVVPAHPLPKNWLIYGGIDSGSGTSDAKSRKYNHAAAFVFVAVSPDFRMARIFGGRKLSGIQTTAADILQHYRNYIKENNINPVQQTYDWADADLYTIATRQGMSLVKADKDRKSGFQLMNTLFDRGVLKIFDTDELRPLIQEILNLSKHTSKRHRSIEDDYTDCTRYALKIIPFDWTFLNEMEFALDKVQEEKLLAPKTQLDLRREFVFGKEETKNDIEKEIDEWAEMFDTY
jgi:hypothetical protein